MLSAKKISWGCCLLVTFETINSSRSYRDVNSDSQASSAVYRLIASSNSLPTVYSLYMLLWMSWELLTVLRRLSHCLSKPILLSLRKGSSTSTYLYLGFTSQKQDLDTNPLLEFDDEVNGDIICSWDQLTMSPHIWNPLKPSEPYGFWDKTGHSISWSLARWPDGWIAV